jgi:hypothetical protein
MGMLDYHNKLYYQGNVLNSHTPQVLQGLPMKLKRNLIKIVQITDIPVQARIFCGFKDVSASSSYYLN